MEKRKQIIINEINYWKESRLLPDVYCNFLLKLYTENEVNETPSKKENGITPRLFVLYVMVAIGVLALSFVVIYFTQFSPTMQISFQFLLLMMSIYYSVYLYPKRERIAHIYIVISTLLSFQFVIELNSHIYNNFPMIKAGSVFILCILWSFIGWKWKVLYLLLAGVAGVIIFFLFILMNGTVGL